MLDNGYVKLPIKMYDELKAENDELRRIVADSVPAVRYQELADRIEQALSIRDYYGEERPMLQIDLEPLSEIIVDKLEDSKYAGSYKLKEFDGYNNNTTIATCFDEDNQA